MDPQEVVYSTWPVSVPQYPETGEDSWKNLIATVSDLGCTIGLRARSTAGGRKARTYRAAVLTIKGPSCRDVYEHCLKQAVRLGFDLSRVRTGGGAPLPVIVMSFQ